MTNLDSVIHTLVTQYPRLQYSKRYFPDFPEPVFDMPVPVLPHRRGDIIISAHSQILKAEPPHRHNYFLINYVYRGNYATLVNGQPVTLHEHDIYLSQPFVPHCLLEHGSEGDCILSIRVRKELLLRSLMPVLPKNEAMLDFFVAPLNMKKPASFEYMIFHADPSLEDRIHNTINYMIEEYVHMDPGYDRMLDTHLATLFALFSRYHMIHPEDNNQKNTEALPLIDALLQYISNNCATTNLTKVAEEFHYNPNYISTLLQKKTGQTFSDLIRDYRLLRACSLLKNSNLPIDEIAVLVGYPHTSNFYKTFKKQLSISPREYRREKQLSDSKTLTK